MVDKAKSMNVTPRQILANSRMSRIKIFSFLL